MTDILWSQDFFASGELSPMMYSRITTNVYYKGLKTAKNVISYPTGAAGKRFGTVFLNEVVSETDYRQVYFKAFPYLNECCYLLIFRDENIDIYLEGYLIANVTSTGIKADEVSLIDHTVLDNVFRVTTGLYKPKDLTRVANAANNITAFTSSTLTVTTPIVSGGFWPARFNASSAANLPATSPQIHFSKTYFVRAASTTTIKIYSTAQEAAADINAYTISSSGTSATLLILNTWSFPDVVFKNLPVFDFDGGYDSSRFAVSAGLVNSQNIIVDTTATYAFTSKLIGGAFFGNGGIGRIVSLAGPSPPYCCTVDTIVAFPTGMLVNGKQALITEPAWSDLRTWPRKCSSFQNRAAFANTDLLPNGLWLSVTNDYNNFDDLQDTDDDSAIGWFPSSDTINYIEWIVPYRSLTVHTNSGVYSTPLSVETAITPNNFSLTLQDSTPADSVQPRAIDNQLIVLSGNDAHSLIWDGFNNSYSSSIISVANEQLIRSPIDEAEYVDRVRAGSRYMFIVNLDGSLAIYQTLIAEEVTGFTPAYLEQSYGNAYFRWVTSNFDGRAWFVTEREIATSIASVSLSLYTPTPPETGTTIFTATAHGMPIVTITAVIFSTSGTLLTTTPQIELATYYWAIAIDADTFQVYESQEDADADENAIVANLIPANNNITPWPLTSKLFIEQISFDVYVDCAGLYPTLPPYTATDTISGQTRFNAQEIMMQGDGFGFQQDGVVAGDVKFIAHGVDTEVSTAQYGFPIDVNIVSLPISLSLSGSPKGGNLVDTKHVRFLTFLFVDTIGGNVTWGNGSTPVAIKTLNQTIPGLPPEPLTGSFEMSLFGAWNDFNYNTFTLVHREPFDMKLTGIFYKVDA